MVQNEADTIVAEATPKGRGGVGIVRISGSKTIKIAEKLLKKTPKIREADYLSFYDANGSVLDQGIALFFKGPYSFTGEDVLELQGHGGPVVIDAIISAVLATGARMALPGEFSLRAFLNNKMDLLQAEAVSDLINAASKEAAHSAIRSLQGVFSKTITDLVENLTRFRMFIESAIDFPEEELTFLKTEEINLKIEQLVKQLEKIEQEAGQGVLMSEGIKVVMMGRPNAGKSSLFNLLTGNDRAIVTHIPGTTRDILRETISVDGLLVELIDTAGLRESTDIIEEEGIRRALKEIELADHLILVTDRSENEEMNLNQLFPEWVERFPKHLKKTILANKIDKVGLTPEIMIAEDNTVIGVSAKTGAGIDLLRQHFKKIAGFNELKEGSFMARRRHLEALSLAKQYLNQGKLEWNTSGASELLAETLRQAQVALGEITGKVSSDDLLGKIFSEFCIGK